MNTNKMELNLEEMENVNGGCVRPESQRMNRENHGSSTSGSTVSEIEIIVRTLGKAACDWVTGLFD